MLKIVKKNVEKNIFSTFFSTYFFQFFFEVSYKWRSYRGFTAAKIVHVFAEIVQIQKIDPYTYHIVYPQLNTVQTYFAQSLKFGQYIRDEY